MTYSPTDFSSAGVAAGAAAAQAGKSVSCQSQTGSLRCILWGLNSGPIPNGVVATVSLNVSPSTSDSSSAVQILTPAAANSSAAAISASASGGTVTILQTPVLNGFTCSPISITPATASTCTLDLSSAAGSGGATISLSSSPADVNLASTVTVPQGATSTTFPMTAKSVATQTSVILTASYAGVSETFGLTVHPLQAALSAISVSPSTFVGGQPGTGTVSLTSAAGSGGALVSLSSSNSTVLKVPASVTVPEGSTFALFSVTTGSVTTVTSISLTASYASVTKTYSVTVSDYTYSRSVTISHSHVPNTDQSNFPFLFNTTSPLFKTVANGGHVNNSHGYDIIFTSDAAGTKKLNHEIESYNGSTGQLIAWVQIPTLSHTTDTIIYLFYGNSRITASQENKPGVWNANYEGVWHLPNGTVLSALDSTANGNNGTLVGPPSAVAGEIGGGAGFNGTNQAITVAAASSINALSHSFTYELWFKSTNTAQTNTYLLQNSSPTGTQNSIIYNYVSNKIEFFALGYTGSNPRSGSQLTVSDTNWHKIDYTYNGTTWAGYLDGSQIFATKTTFSLSTHAGPLYIGGADSGAKVKGGLDEIRISNIARSSDWIATEYHNQSSPSTFYSLGTEQ